MPQPFEPVGDVARWRLLLELFESVLNEHGVDTVITYKDMAEVLDLDADEDRRTIQGAVPRAAKELLEVQKHAIKAVPNKGYRIVQPSEHLDLARERKDRSDNQLVLAGSVVANVDYNGLSLDARQGLELVGRAVQFQLGLSRQLDLRQKDLEERLSAVQSTVQRTEEDLASHAERIAWLEAQNGGRPDGEPQSA